MRILLLLIPISIVLLGIAIWAFVLPWLGFTLRLLVGLALIVLALRLIGRGRWFNQLPGPGAYLGVRHCGGGAATGIQSVLGRLKLAGRFSTSPNCAASSANKTVLTLSSCAGPPRSASAITLSPA